MDDFLWEVLNPLRSTTPIGHDEIVSRDVTEETDMLREIFKMESSKRISTTSLTYQQCSFVLNYNIFVYQNPQL